MAASALLVSVAGSITLAAANHLLVSGAGALNGHEDILLSSEALGFVIKNLLVLTIWGIIGIGISLALKTITKTIITILVYALLVEPTLTSASNEGGRSSAWLDYMPGALNWTIVWSPEESGSETIANVASTSLTVNLAILLLSCYAFAILTIGGTVYLKTRRQR
ncbi:hypothetical protein [Corynebacterium sp. CNJ-954]|uniref:hypothetical protein n=1 Tax=Corynebacterium sp. CNJ-954 TaxID=1904962 RepID=UPI00111520F0|nr:hypothetical protein [Corynebacterium sp. CNJ-954]